MERLDHRDVDVDVDVVGRLVAESVGFTPGDVALAAQRAAAVAFNRIRTSENPHWVTNDDLFTALRRTTASVSAAALLALVQHSGLDHLDEFVQGASGRADHDRSA